MKMMKNLNEFFTRRRKMEKGSPHWLHFEEELSGCQAGRHTFGKSTAAASAPEKN